MNRSAMRDLAFKFLYELESHREENLEEQIKVFFENNEISEEKVEVYVISTVKGIEEKLEDIKKHISENLKENWSIDRLSKINIAILKISIYEILYTDVPFKVAVNEAVEIAKKYSDDSAPNFINGVLASIIKKNNIA